jgi:citrate synthase
VGEKWVTKITRVEPNHLTLRGYALDELIGTVPFTSVAFLAVMGRLPVEAEARLFDAVLASSVDHGVTTTPACPRTRGKSWRRPRRR